MTTNGSGPDLTPRRERHVSPFGRAVDAMHVTAHTPNEQVFGEVNGWYDIRVSFTPGYPERVGDAEVETQLTRLGRLLFAARTREYYAILSEHLEPNPAQLTASRARFEASLEDEVVTGTAAAGAIQVTSVGMRLWTVSVASGTVARLGGEALGEEVTRAANQLVEQWLGVIAEHKRDRWERRA
jgi:hypothetical protein